MSVQWHTMAALASDAMGQAFQAAAFNVQLIELPIFFTQCQRGQTHSQAMVGESEHQQIGGNWSDIQKITHFRNASRGDMVSWYDTITLLDDTALT